MKINQYACISLTYDYQKKGDIPDCKDQWIILNKAQCIKHKLQEYEPIVGPGKLDSQNTDNQFTNQTPNSSSIFTIINDKLLIAFKQKILQYDRISDLFSTDKYQTCLPQQQHTVTSGNVISMHPNQNQLIVRTENAIILYKFSNSNFSLQKTYNYSNIKQLNIQNNVLFLCLSDRLIAINLINQTEQILKADNNIVAGYLKDQEYYYICENSYVVKSLQRNYELAIPIPIAIKALFLIDKFICVCGYQTKYEPYDDEDEEPATYSSHVFWFDITCNQPIKESSHREVDLIVDTNNKGDFGITQLSDLYIVFGSNLRVATFWSLDRLCQQAKRYENSDEILELLQHSEIRGLVTYKSNPFIGFGMNQKNFRCIERNPNVCIFDKKGGLQMYEFFNFKKIVEYQINQPQPQNSIFQNSQNLFQNPQLVSTRSQKFQKGLDDIKFTVIECEKKEMNIIANPPFNLQLITQNKDSQMVFGKGRIDYQFRLHQNQNPSANLVIDYQHFQIIGHEREIVILTPIIVQQILSEQQQPKLQIQKVTSNPAELINSLFLFQNKILIQTNTSLYLVNYQDNQWNVKLLLNHNNITRVQVLDQYLLLTISQDGVQQILYEYKKDSLQQKVSHRSNAGCLLQLDGQPQLLLIIDDQLYILKDFVTKQLVQIDIEIIQSKEYFIAQLHENHIYLSFATIDEYEFNHFILNYDAERNQAKSELHLNDVLSNLNINDIQTQITNFDWNITSINTPIAKIIIIFPNGVQEGFVFQVCGNDLRTIDNEKGEPIQLSSYTHFVKGISTLKYVLPNEEKLGDKPGLCKAKQEQKEFQYQMQPSILIYEFDEKSNLTIHRLLLIKLDKLDDSTPLLQLFEDKPNPQKNSQSEQLKTPDRQQNEISKQLINQQPQPPKRVTQITYQLSEFCKQSMKQLNGEEEEDLLMKPYFSIFTSQKFLDELSAQYTQIHNTRKLMKQKTLESSSVQDFCLLRKSFDIPKFKFSYDEIQTTLASLSKVEEQFSWICNFVINTLQMNPIKRNKITFGEFEFPSIHHITPKKQPSNSKTKIGRKIVFSEFCDQEPKTDLQMAFIEKLCQAHKSNVKYLQLGNESSKEINDLSLPLNAMSTTSFGIPLSRFSQKQQIFDTLYESNNYNQNQVSNSKDQVKTIQAQTENGSSLMGTFKGQTERNQKIEPIQSQRKDKSSDTSKKNNKLFDDNDKGLEKKSDANSQQQLFDINNKGMTRTKGGFLSQESDQESINPFKSDFQSVREMNMVESQIIDPSKQKDNLKESTKPLFGQPLKTEANQEKAIFGQPLKTEGNQEKSMFGQQTLNNTTGLFKDLKLDDKSGASAQNSNILKQQTPNEKDKTNQDKPAVESNIFGQLTSQQTQNSNKLLNLNSNENPTEKQQQKPSQPPLFNTNFGDGKLLFSSLTPNVESASSFLGIKTETKDAAQNEQSKKKQEDSSLLNSKKESQSLLQNLQKPENQEQNQIPKTSTPAPAPAPVPQQTTLFTFGQPSEIQVTPANNVTQQEPQIQPQAQAPLQLGSSMFNSQKQDVNFNTYSQTQPTSLFLNCSNQPFQGMQNSIGIQQQSQPGPLIINSSTFGSTSSVFDQKNTAPPPQQKINFSNLQSQGLPNTLGGFFGQTPQTNQVGFLQTSSIQFGFDPNQEKPRK
ncbi:unnamed protein product (macronuclear) [Paramecium tetraurelia]|uniref:Cleavage/polyadenylation specificity factor A subunit C-terminal domain-containing protein n=1 Tax=Paramecium tetraurelia TaxID=5888 RepID=A0CYJ3_PARTE|nr:uncharacterized protein GSPATT00011460001 [Paramecium tetraurelia]CAK75860.1 unnamed protein product [Paramecium tetraurelia]|eukprot:XP_001443257.1 hypothetical protein (macronuclear) [Paramecium tetraurelia strain d4-2]